eukprot:6464833-Amphidinium_carterae.3
MRKKDGEGKEADLALGVMVSTFVAERAQSPHDTPDTRAKKRKSLMGLADFNEDEELDLQDSVFVHH